MTPRETAAMSSAADEIVVLTRRLLDAVVAGDWETYRELVADDITCFEPEARGQLVAGLPFHEFYFRLAGGRPRTPAQVTTTLASPVVRLLGGDVAVIAYVRLTQKLDAAGAPLTASCEETRVWQRMDGRWKHVHFHRSVGS